MNRPMVVHTDLATSRLGAPVSTVERGTVQERSLFYSCRWNWPCGCSGEIIAGSLIELHCCPQHKTSAI
jgi:hypothetical protein